MERIIGVFFLAALLLTALVLSVKTYNGLIVLRSFSAEGWSGVLAAGRRRPPGGLCPSRATSAAGPSRACCCSMPRSPCVPARYLIVCPSGHLDEFPYDWWVHEGAHCPKAAHPELAMSDTSQRGATAFISCRACRARPRMSQAQGEEGRQRLPRCRGRHPHLGIFTEGGCQAEPRVMLVGASNLWFAATQSIIDMPRLDPEEQKRDRLTVLGRALGEDLESVRENLPFVRALLKRGDADAVRLLLPAPG